jgi:hypothetical protein
LEFFQRGKLSYSSTIKDCQSLFETESRYQKVPIEDRKFIFDRFLKEQKKRDIDAFTDLLKECRSNGILSRNSKTSGEGFENLKKLMENDSRYKALLKFSEERDKVIVDYILFLAK